MPAIPATLARLVARLPVFPGSVAFTTAFNLIAWPALRELDWACVEGKRFAIHLRDLGARARFSVSPRGLKAEQDARADVTFTATTMDFLRLALRLEDPDTLFFNRRLVIEGDTDLGLTVKNLLDAVEFDAVLAALPAPVRHVTNALRTRMETIDTHA